MCISKLNVIEENLRGTVVAQCRDGETGDGVAGSSHSHLICRRTIQGLTYTIQCLDPESTVSVAASWMEQVDGSWWTVEEPKTKRAAAKMRGYHTRPPSGSSFTTPHMHLFHHTARTEDDRCNATQAIRIAEGSPQAYSNVSRRAPPMWRGALSAALPPSCRLVETFSMLDWEGVQL